VPRRPGAGPAARWTLLVIWAAVVLIQVSQHVMWRDEVRALTRALSAPTWASFFTTVRGDHPLIWYVLLRAAHDIVPRPEILPAVAFAVAAAAASLLAARAPFSAATLALVLSGNAFLFEYSVMARNYGIGMLAMLAFAALYRRHRDRGLVLGIVLFLLCNTNVQSAFLAGALLLFWFLDVANEEGWRWSPKYRVVAVNGACATLGALTCFLAVYPPVNDSTMLTMEPIVTSPIGLARALLSPGRDLEALVALPLQFLGGQGSPSRYRILHGLLSLLLYGSTLVFVRRPAALGAAIAGIAGSALLLRVLGLSAYRHAGETMVFVLTLLWITLDGGPARQIVQWSGASLRRAGWTCLTVLLVLQSLFGLKNAYEAIAGPPRSSSRDLAQRLSERPDLSGAIIMADPDYLIEPLPYYLSNPLFQPRARRFDAYVVFTHQERRDIALDDLVAEGCSIGAEQQRPVLVLLAASPERLIAEARINEAYEWTLRAGPEQMRRFNASSVLLWRLRRSTDDENYDVYRLTCKG
jgi:hypothetical protein